MMSLLLVFFVMMLSFSSVDQVKFKAFMGSIREAFGVQNIDQLVGIPKGTDVVFVEFSAGGSLFDQLNSLVSQAFPGSQLEKNDQGILLTVPGRLLFESGRAELKPEMEPLLRKIAELLQNRSDTYLQIEGHTDDVPINTSRFPSNWELSSGRAIAVLRFLIEKTGLSPHSLVAAGHADSRPLEPNDSLENREKNRRVEFLFVKGPQPHIGRIARPLEVPSSDDGGGDNP